MKTQRWDWNHTQGRRKWHLWSGQDRIVYYNYIWIPESEVTDHDTRKIDM